MSTLGIPNSDPGAIRLERVPSRVVLGYFLGKSRIARNALMCYCTKVIYRAVTEKQTLASIKSAYQYGGDFMSKIAAAALAGDPRNRDRVLRAFPEIIAKYGPGSAFYNEYI